MEDEIKRSKPARGDLGHLKKVPPDEIFASARPIVTPAASEPEPEENAEVAPGRSVHIANPNGKKVLAGTLVENNTARNWEVLACQVFGPGSFVRLPISEIKRLRASGHLIDPSKPPINILRPEVERHLEAVTKVGHVKTIQ